MKKFVLVLSLLITSVFFLSHCYLMNSLHKSDAELEEHYRNAKLKPFYKQSQFLDRAQHYVVMSKSDTLPLLVMVHGAPGAWYGYMNLTDDSLLQANFKIVAVDRLGYGKSGYGKEVLSVEEQALSIKNIIETENTSGKKVYLLGRSYGAPITAWLAINYPQKFEKLIMVSPVIDPEKEKFYWFSDLGRSPLIQWALPEMLNVATKEKFAHRREMKLMQNEWEKLCTPTYVLVGENDAIADTANYSFARKHITNCSAVFMKLENTGHQITHQKPKLIKELLMEESHCENDPLVAEHKTQMQHAKLTDLKKSDVSTAMSTHKN